MNTIPYTGRWKEISSTLNSNFAMLDIQLQYLSDLTLYNKGRFLTAEELTEAYPDPMDGSYAYVGSEAPYAIYLYTNSQGWYDSGETGEPNEFDWTNLPTASTTEIGLMTPEHVMRLYETYKKALEYEPSAVKVVTETELEAMYEAGTLEEGVLYLGTEEE